MRQSLRLILAYRGKGFHGWQAQEGVRTVEGCLRAAAGQLSRGPVETAGASRTDTGVHALGQCALVVLESELPTAELGRALDALTPSDITILRCEPAPAHFQPRFQALEKRYLYRIDRHPIAPVFSRGNAWWIRQRLDLDEMHRAAQELVGEHDFASFRNRSKGAPENTVRRLRVLDWREWEGHLLFQVIGGGFLFRMVRNLVGTLVEVGRGRRTPEEVREILRAEDRTRAGESAPPEGLYLMEVSYADTAPCALDLQPPLF